MAKKGSFSKVYDKNGDYVDVEAARFDGTRTFQMQGDVSATQTWNGDSASALTLNTSIGAKKVTTDKINDKAVQTGQIDDGAVGLTQIATNAMNGTVQDNDSKLATHAAVKTYVDSQISGQGTYLGKKTVAEVNAMTVNNLHNGDRVQMADAGTINLGPGGVGFDVEAGEDLILYKSGSTVQWDSMDGNFKTKQTAVSDPTASGTGLTFIDSASQDENGEMTLSKKTVQDGTTSQKGVVQLEDSHSSTSTTKAATPKNVKEAYDLASTANSGLANKQDKPSSATENNIATFNGTKSTKDSGKAFLPSTSTWDGTSDDKVPTAKAVQALLDDKADFNKVVAIADATIERTGQSGSGWYKFAESTFNSAKQNINSILDVYASQGDTKLIGNISICVRSGNSSGSAITVAEKNLFTDKWNTYFNFKIVVRGTTGSATVELWACCTRAYGGVSIIERNTSSFTPSNTKQNWWTYTSYSSNGGTDAPETDAGNNVTVTDVDIVYRQHAVSNATSGNFAGLDANGLLTDSGKKASDFELVTNKVTSVRPTSSATDTAYPSEKAVATGLDKKANAINVVAFADATYRRTDSSTDEDWLKIASLHPAGNFRDALASFDLFYGQLATEIFKVNVRIDVRLNGNGTVPMLSSFVTERTGRSDFGLRVVTRGTVGDCDIELWVRLPKNNISMALIMVAGSDLVYSDWKLSKDKTWTFYSSNNGGTSIPVQDTSSNLYVYEPTENIRLQHAIASPTNNNLVAMDANGLVKDSGVAVLPSTSTWDGTSDAKVPTAKAVQAKLDAISTAAGAEAEVTAAALDDLDARMQSVEDAVNSDNIGDKIADSLDAQVLKVGGQDVVANIKYVAAQSGGGGDLMKTVAGTQTSVLRFMNDSEAVSIWNAAKQAAANAS